MKLPVAFAMLFCAALCKLDAQVPTATLVGTVTDPSGALVAGVKVEVRNSGTNEVRKAESDQRGEFTAPDRIIAVHNPDGRIDRRHPLCPYPQVAQYKGSGSIYDAANFVCKQP